VANVKIDEGLRELSLPAGELDPIRLEFAAACLTLAQGLPLRDEGAQSSLEVFDASHSAQLVLAQALGRFSSRRAHEFARWGRAVLVEGRRLFRARASVNRP
jgi:hypothetical protein